MPIILLTILLLWTSGMFAKSQSNLTDEQILQIQIPQLKVLADSCMHQKDTVNAIHYYIILAGKYNDHLKQSNQRICAEACAAIGAIYYDFENYIPALEFYLKSIQISESQNFNDILGKCYNNIGNIYSIFEDNHQALEYYQIALAYAEQAQNAILEKKILINLSGISAFLSQADQARTYYTRMMKYAGQDSLVEYFGYFNRGLIESIEGNLPAAVADLLSAAQYAQEQQMEPEYIASVYGNLGNIYYESNYLDSALYYCRLNNTYTKNNHLKYNRQRTLKTYYSTCQAIGNTMEAYRLQDEYLKLSDSIFNQNEYNKIRRGQLAYEMNKNYKRIQALTTDQTNKLKQIQEQRFLLLFLTSGIFLVASALWIVWRQKKRLYKTYKELFERNRELLQMEQNNQLHRKHLNLQIDALKEYCTQLNDQNLQLQQQLHATDPENSGEEKLTNKEEEKPYASNRINDDLKENLLREINRIMEETTVYYDADFSLERLASLVGSNSKYISQIINETYGKNFRTFVNEYRIREVCKRLLDNEHFGSYTIKAISESVGYKSYTNFIDLFKKTIGLTPAIYQKLAKEQVVGKNC